MAAIAAMLFFGYAFLGVQQPTNAVLAMEEHPTRAGSASAILGAAQLILASLLMSFAAPLVHGRLDAMILAVAGCGVMTWLLAMAFSKPAPEVRAQPAPSPAE